MAPLFTDLPTSYSVGTATVAANGTTVTGQGTVWLDSLRVGDLFGTHKGFAVRIAAIASNTSLTLAYGWPGAAQTAAAYEIQLTPRSVGVQEATRQLLTLLANGNLSGIAGAANVADTISYFAGSGNIAVTTFAAYARALLAGTGQLANSQVRNDLTPDKAFRRGNIIGTVAQSAGVPTGAILERGSNANGEYVRFADGTQICQMRRQFGGSGAGVRTQDITYPITFVSKPQLLGAANYLASGFRYLGPTTGTEPGVSSATSVGIEVTNGGYGNLFCELRAEGRWF